MGWTSTYTLKPGDFFEVSVRYTHLGVEETLPYYRQETFWYVQGIYLKADQETGRLYHWSVRVVREGTGTGGKAVYVPLSPASQEWAFSWK